MRTSKWLVMLASGCLAFQTYSAHGCQYNVREVGFIDLGIEPYRLLAYVPENTSADGVSSLKEAMDVALAETNIRFQSVTTGADANQAAMELAKGHGITRFPAAILVSPDGQSMPVPIADSGPMGGSVKAEGFGDGSVVREENHRQAALDDATLPNPQSAPSVLRPLASVLNGILDSPIRRLILEKSADAYGVVLLIEGPGQQANAAARETVSAAISRIGEQLEFLPKPIKKPPELVVLDQKSLAREQVLLWTLRLRPEDVNQPHAAVFYGRGRWIGPLFEGETLTADNLTQLLSVIGGDCECGLDHRWLQGTMLPARWDETLQQKAVQSLGFDPENPMIKMEMVSIIRRGMGGFDYPGVPFEYREIEVGNDIADDAVRVEGGIVKAEGLGDGSVVHEGNHRQAALDDATPEHLRLGESPTPNPRPAIVGQVLAVSLGGMAALVGVTSLVLILRARKS